MRVTRILDATTPASRPAGVLVPRAIEKSSPASTLRRDTPQGGTSRDKPAPRLTVELVSQDETQAFDPYWDGPRLVPAFVTQLLAQLTPGTNPRVAAATAYGSAACPRTARLLDRSS
jgi:hypothetical protein